jgi:hypothetical protein
MQIGQSSIAGGSLTSASSCSSAQHAVCILFCASANDSFWHLHCSTLRQAYTRPLQRRNRHSRGTMFAKMMGILFTPPRTTIYVPETGSLRLSLTHISTQPRNSSSSSSRTIIDASVIKQRLKSIDTTFTPSTR